MSESHHAHLLICDRKSAEKFAVALCAELGVKVKNNPDYLVLKVETFGINEARNLSEIALRKGFIGKKVFLIIPERITPEAQNALLKTFEDPPGDTYFMLVVREEAEILPTLRSRMRSTHLKGNFESSGAASQFLKSALKERLVFAKKFADEEKNLADFLDELLLELRDKERKGSERTAVVYNMRRFAGDTSALPKMILEHLALVLP